MATKDLTSADNNVFLMNGRTGTLSSKASLSPYPSGSLLRAPKFLLLNQLYRIFPLIIGNPLERSARLVKQRRLLLLARILSLKNLNRQFSLWVL
jgi:hypothetical protein